MPEGHTLHRLAGALQPLVGSCVEASSPQGRFRQGAAVVDGRVVEGVEARGKHLFLDAGDLWLHIHLGLAGAMFQSDPGGSPRPGVRLRLVGGVPRVAWDLVAPLRCELLSHGEVAAILERLGPDPLRGDPPEAALGRMQGSTRTIGELLLDQSVVAGVGNVFRAEALHLCRIHPQRRGASLSEHDLACLWATLTCLMRRAAVEGRILSVDTDEHVDRSAIPEDEGRFVYKQARCRSCGGDVRSWTLGARVAYACETCQPAMM